MIIKVIAIVVVIAWVVSAMSLIRSYEKSIEVLNESIELREIEVEMAYRLLAISEEDVKATEKTLKDYYGDMIESLVDVNVELMKKLNAKEDNTNK